MQIQPQRLKFTLLIFVLLGVLLGILIPFSSAPTFVLALIFSIFLFLRYSNRQDGRFISLLFITGILSRILAAYFLHLFLTYYGFRGADLFGDGGDNAVRGWMLSQFWLGDMIYYRTLATGYNMHGWTYFASFFYTLFGHSILGLKFINCLLSTLTGIMVYFITKEILSVKAARLAAVLAVFFPSMFLWSLSNLKESGIIFLIIAVIWSFILFVKTKKPYYLVFLILAVCFLHPLRSQLGICMGFIAFFSYFCFCISKLSVVKRIGICLTALIILQIFLSVNNMSLKSVVSRGLAVVINIHRGVIGSGGSCYKLLDEKYYFYATAKGVAADMNLLEYARFLFKAWGHFLFEPLPWRIHTKQILVSYPQMVLWYVLTPFALLGILLAFRYNWRLSLILFAHLFIVGSLFAMIGGNVGTTLRHRDQITPVFLVFASAGLVKIYAREFGQDLKK